MAKQENKNNQVKNTEITERIKTFDDACRELGSDNRLVREYQVAIQSGVFSTDAIAFFKLRIIAAALNEGWAPTFVDDECRYVPCFELYTQEEYDGMGEEWKQRHPLQLLCGAAGRGAGCGIVYSSWDDAWDIACPAVGPRLAVKSKELAIYFGKQFIEIWKYFVV